MVRTGAVPNDRRGSIEPLRSFFICTTFDVCLSVSSQLRHHEIDSPSRCSSALAAQALPATVEVDQPAAASEGPAAIRVGGRRRSAGGARSREGGRRDRAGERRDVHRELRPAREGRQPLHHPADRADRRPARRRSARSIPSHAASSRRFSRRTRRRRCAPQPAAITGA